MGQPYVGEIRMFGGNFAPQGWAFCNGQLIAIADNDVLFTLIGATYGGDGQETFALPNLQSRIPMHVGNNGSNTHVIGEMAGVESVTLTSQQMPIHNHTALAQTQNGNQQGPGNNVWATSGQNQFSTGVPTASMNAQAIDVAGGSQPHDNMMPFLVVNFIISLYGVFPTQN